ncbi:LytTR family DNA-binding domain-containing protein [uncultured Alistipes sp.]|uniref:LytR/AlgR family response regulator transcription factor n=1 Tax=uncultured Alistipes sp. TaxID=538949 RepID=UPI00260BF49E|nr:LytTR family DNA-binding domain-containing protein [uncultured Alistipes sp.]
MIRTIVVDDEPLARELMGGYVRQTPFLSLEGLYASAVEALDRLVRDPVDLLFLDIQMPQLDGLELSRMVDTRTRVVFTTAFEQYALEGFRVDALDYLLKPISYAEFLRAAGKAQRWFESVATTSPEPEPQARTIFVKTDYKMLQLRLEDILYIEGVKDYVRIFTADGGDVKTQMSMKSLEETLPSDRFIRVHRSFIVNLSKIRIIERNRIVFGKVYIPVSDSYKDRFMEAISRTALLL